MSNYPSEYDNLVDPESTDKLNAPSHSELHRNVNSSLAAIQATLGLEPAGGYDSVADRLQSLDKKEILFSYSGELEPRTSNAWLNHEEGSLYVERVWFVFLDSGEGDNTLELLVDGIPQEVFEVSTDTHVANLEPLVEIPPEGVVQISLVPASGADSITVGLVVL